MPLSVAHDPAHARRPPVGSPAALTTIGTNPPYAAGMAGILVLTLVLGVLTAVFTVVWWAMGESWVKKDRRARGRHATERTDGSKSSQPRVIRDR